MFDNYSDSELRDLQDDLMLEADEVYKGKDGNFELVSDSLSLRWRSHAVGTSKLLRSLLRNDNMLPH